ncbi:MAG: hypothetical protein ACYTGG_13800 [Planctomycetota bacterium]
MHGAKGLVQMLGSVPLLALSALTLVAGCGDEPADAQPGTPSSDHRYIKCWVHVRYEGPDLTFTEPYDQIRGPIKLSTLSNLEGTRHPDWNNRIIHLTVGATARVTVWSDEEFEGESRVFAPNEKAGPFRDGEFGDGISSLMIEYVPE